MKSIRKKQGKKDDIDKIIASLSKQEKTFLFMVSQFVKASGDDNIGAFMAGYLIGRQLRKAKK